MTASPEEEKHRKSLRRWTIIFGAVVGVILLYAGYRFILRRAAEQARAEVRAAGFPVTLAELAAWHPEIAAGPNAALSLREAGVHVKNVDDAEFQDLWDVLPYAGGPERPRRQEKLAREELAGFEKYLAANGEALRLLHAAAAIEPCRFPGEYRIDFRPSGWLGHLLKQMDCLELLRLDAVAQAAKGETGKAVASVGAMLRIGRALAGEPLADSLLTGRDGQGAALGALEHLLSTVTLSSPELQALAAAAARAEEPEQLRRTMLGERAYAAEEFFAREDGYELFSRGWSPDGLSPRDRSLAIVYRAGGCQELDFLKSLDLFERLIDAASLPLPDRHLAAERAAEKAAASFGPSFVHKVTRGLGRSLAETFSRDTQAIARLRAACAALAAERCRLARGKLPGKLDDLVPEFLEAVPEDPFDAKPIRWKLFPWGYAAYSVGPNKTDDGGAEFPEAGKPGEDSAGRPRGRRERGRRR